MLAWEVRVLVGGFAVVSLVACGPDSEGQDTGHPADVFDSADSGEFVDTAEPQDTEAPMDTDESEDTGEWVDTEAAPIDFSDIDALIAGHLESAPIPAVGAALVVDGALVWADGYGWADIENAIPATGDTAFTVSYTHLTLPTKA